jgi:hypothetical protein
MRFAQLLNVHHITAALAVMMAVMMYNIML